MCPNDEDLEPEAVQAVIDGRRTPSETARLTGASLGAIRAAVDRWYDGRPQTRGVDFG